MCLEGLVWHKAFHMLLLVGKRPRLIYILHFIDHTPDRRITAAGYCRYDFRRMLAVDHKINAIAAADLDRINLKEIKLVHRFPDMPLGQRALIVLIRNQVPDWD